MQRNTQASDLAGNDGDFGKKASSAHLSFLSL
jgi:hypothetical protein